MPTFYTFIIYLFIGSTLFADINTALLFKDNPQISDINQGLVIPIPKDELEKKWSLIYQEVFPNGSWVFEWIPKGEKIEDWSELIQIQFFPISLFAHPLTASSFSSFFIQAIKARYPEITFSEISHTEDSILMEWALAKDSEVEKAQSELTRFFSNQEGIYRIAFTQKTPVMDKALKEKWESRLSQAKIVQVEPKPMEPAEVPSGSKLL